MIFNHFQRLHRIFNVSTQFLKDFIYFNLLNDIFNAFTNGLLLLKAKIQTKLKSSTQHTRIIQPPPTERAGKHNYDEWTKDRRQREETVDRTKKTEDDRQKTKDSIETASAK